MQDHALEQCLNKKFAKNCLLVALLRIQIKSTILSYGCLFVLSKTPTQVAKETSTSVRKEESATTPL